MNQKSLFLLVHLLSRYHCFIWFIFFIKTVQEENGKLIIRICLLLLYLYYLTTLFAFVCDANLPIFSIMIIYHPYEQIETINEDEDDDMFTSSSNDDGGVFIPLPEEIKTFNWYDLVTPENRESYTRASAKKVTKDYLPESGCVKKKHIYACMQYRRMDDDFENYNIIKDELILMRDVITKKINAWLSFFVVFCGRILGMEINKKPISNWNEYLKWVELKLKTEEDAMIIIKSLYLSFQHSDDYRLHLTCSICMEFNLSIQDALGGHSSRRRVVNDRITRNFLERLVSHRQNEFRKQVCTRSGKFSGWTYRIIRPMFTKDCNRQRNFPRHFHNWMLQYKTPTYQRKKLGRPYSNESKKDRGMMTHKNKKLNKKRTREEILEELEEQKRHHALLLSELEAVENNGTYSLYLFLYQILY